MNTNKLIYSMLIIVLVFNLMPLPFQRLSAEDRLVSSDSGEPVELARNKPVSASSERSTNGRIAANANDGDISTQWESTSIPAYITIDLQAAYHINKAAMSLGDWSIDRTQSITVLGSLDGVEFTPLVPNQDYHFGKVPKNRIEIAFKTSEVRYVRFEGTHNSSAGNGIQFTELEIYQSTAADYSGVVMTASSVSDADLTVSNVMLTPAAPVPGEEVILRAEITNNGSSATNEAEIVVGFKINPSVKPEIISTGRYTGVLQPGKTVVVSGEGKWTAPKGTHAVQAIADLENQVNETDETNNKSIRYIAVRAIKPKSEMTEFEKRAMYVLETYATNEPEHTDRTRWVKEAPFYAQARFELGIDVETAISYIQSINDDPGNAAMFFYTANIDTYMRYGHLYPESLRQQVKQKMLAKDYSDNGSTENHYIKYRTAGYFTAQVWPDWDKAAETKEFTERDLKAMMERFVKYGMKEYDSTTYYALYVECLLMLEEFAEDSQMRKQAKMTLDWMMANTAGEWINGYWASSTNRDYAGLGPKIGSAGTFMNWVYFGGEEYPQLRKYENKIQEGMFSVQAALSTYRIPDILTRIVSGREQPYVHLESHDQHPTSKLNPPYGYRKYSYISKNYGVASQFDGYGTLSWSDQMRRWLVRWVSDHPYSTFYMTHPKRGGLNSGATRYEQVIQKEGTIVAVHNIPPTDPYRYINGPLSDAFHKIVEDPSGWIFAHGGSILLAVKPLKPYYWTEETIADSLIVPVIRSEHLKNGVIVETADPKDYTTSDIQVLSQEEKVEAELALFAEAVKKNTVVDASGIDNTNPSIKYTSLAGDELGITYNGTRTINGIPVDYMSWPLIESPYMKQDIGGSILTIQQGGEKLVYDFENWTVESSTEEPAEHPVRILFEDDFENDITGKWDMAGNVGSWSHETDSETAAKVMKGTSTDTSGNPVRKVAKLAVWEDFDQTNRDYGFEFTAKYLGGTVNNGQGEQLRALVRFDSPKAYYFFEFSDRHKVVSFVKYTESTGFVVLNQPFYIADVIADFNFNSYNKYMIMAEGDSFTLHINDQFIMKTVADQEIPAGSAGFMNRNSELWVDRVSITSL